MLNLRHLVCFLIPLAVACKKDDRVPVGSTTNTTNTTNATTSSIDLTKTVDVADLSAAFAANAAPLVGKKATVRGRYFGTITYGGHTSMALGKDKGTVACFLAAEPNPKPPAQSDVIVTGTIDRGSTGFNLTDCKLGPTSL